MHYHGYAGLGDGVNDEYQGTFRTKKDAQAFLKEEKDHYADYRAQGTDPTDLRLVGNVRKLEMVGIEGGIAFGRYSYVEPCAIVGCTTEREWEEGW
jgi:hypothetical protein